MAEDRGRAKHRLTVKLDLEWDADLIAWLATFPKGQRSSVVREALRQVMSPQATADLETLRDVVAGELAKALAGRFIGDATSDVPQAENVDLEAKYGSKLDQMMDRLVNPQSPDARQGANNVAE